VPSQRTAASASVSGTKPGASAERSVTLEQVDSVSSASGGAAVPSALASELELYRRRADDLQQQHQASVDLAAAREAQLQAMESKMTALSAAMKLEQETLLKQIQASKAAETALLEEQLRQREADATRREAIWAQERVALEQQLRAALSTRESAERASVAASEELQAKLDQSHAVHLEAAAELLRATEGFRVAAAMRSKVATYEEKLIAQARKMAALEAKLRQAGIDVSDAASVSDAEPRDVSAEWAVPSASHHTVPRQSSNRSVALHPPPPGSVGVRPFETVHHAPLVSPPRHSVQGSGALPPPPPPPAYGKPTRTQVSSFEEQETPHLGVSGFAASVPLHSVAPFRPPESPWQAAALVRTRFRLVVVSFAVSPVACCLHRRRLPQAEVGVSRRQKGRVDPVKTRTLIGFIA
jgi:hypothetical protein